MFALRSPPPPLFLSLLTTFSQTGHIATAHYSVKRCVYVTTLWIHGAQRWFKGQIHPVCPLQQRNVGVPLLLNLAETLRVQSSEVFFFFFLRVPGGVNRVTRESIDPKPRGAFFLSIYVTPDLSLTGRLPLSVAQTVPQSPVYSLRSGGFQGSSSLSSQTCWGRPAVGLKQKHWVDLLFFLSVCVMQSCVTWLKVV